MTHCYNCGHAGTFVLLAQFALAVSGPAEGRATPPDRMVGSGDDRRRRPNSENDHGHSCSKEGHRRPSSRGPRRSSDWPRSCDPNRSRRGHRGQNEDSPRDGRSRDGRSSSRDDSPPRDDFPPQDAPSARDTQSGRDAPSALDGLPTNGGLSLAVQCPVCDSTDVGVAAADLLARYGSSTTS